MPIQSSASHTVFEARVDATLPALPTEAVIMAAFGTLPPGSLFSSLHPAANMAAITDVTAKSRVDVNCFICYLFLVYDS